MAKLRRCPTCKVVFPTIDALNDHYRKTSHKPLPFKCESCERAFKNSYGLQDHIQSKHPHAAPSSFIYKCEPCNRVFKVLPSLQDHNKSEGHYMKLSTSSVIAQMDAIDLNSRREDDGGEDDDDDNWDTIVNDLCSLKDVRDARRNSTLAEYHSSALLNDNISKPLSSPVSELTSSSPSSGATAGPSPSKLDKATAVARAALRQRFAELGNTTDEINPLLISNIWGPRKAIPSVSNLDGSHSIAATTDLTPNSSNSNEKEVNESKPPLNSLDNITRPFKCPGCLMDFKSFSGFVLHIENRSCMSSMCHEIEDQLNACVTQISNILVLSGRPEREP